MTSMTQQERLKKIKRLYFFNRCANWLLVPVASVPFIIMAKAMSRISYEGISFPWGYFIISVACSLIFFVIGVRMANKELELIREYEYFRIMGQY